MKRMVAYKGDALKNSRKLFQYKFRKLTKVLTMFASSYRFLIFRMIIACAGMRNTVKLIVFVAKAVSAKSLAEVILQQGWPLLPLQFS